MEVDRPQGDVIRNPRKLAGQTPEEDASAPLSGAGVSSACEGACGNNSASPKVQTNRNRCYGCNKKVGFTGLECRCGFVFCGKHRYPEEHSCSFNYRQAARAQLAKTVTGGGEFTKVEKI